MELESDFDDDYSPAPVPKGKPFTSDGCSGFLSYFWREIFKCPPPWEGVCLEHDKKYHKGGGWLDRLKADWIMRGQVRAKGREFDYTNWYLFSVQKKLGMVLAVVGKRIAYFALSWIMFAAVRIGGPWWLPTPTVRMVDGEWRWEWNSVRFNYSLPYPMRNLPGETRANAWFALAWRVILVVALAAWMA